MNEVIVTQEDRDTWQRYMQAIILHETTGPQVVAEIRHAALLEGVRLGLEAGAKAVQAAQHDPAPWCKAREIMAALDPAAIIAKRGEG